MYLHDAVVTRTREVARHPLTTPGRPSINDEHYPPRPAGALERRPKPRSAEEHTFLALGPETPLLSLVTCDSGTWRTTEWTL